jgi:hypothetical protein
MTDKPPLPLIEHEFVPCPLSRRAALHRDRVPTSHTQLCPGMPREAHRAEPPTAEPKETEIVL